MEMSRCLLSIAALSLSLSLCLCDGVVCPVSSGMECGGGELSDSGSSGYWSSDHGNTSPAPSPTNEETERGVVPPSDEGLDMELDQVLFDEPAPRKRKVTELATGNRVSIVYSHRRACKAK